MALGARVGPRDVALASNPPNLGQQVVVADLGEPFERGAALLIHRTHLVLRRDDLAVELEQREQRVQRV